MRSRRNIGAKAEIKIEHPRPIVCSHRSAHVLLVCLILLSLNLVSLYDCTLSLFARLIRPMWMFLVRSFFSLTGMFRSKSPHAAANVISPDFSANDRLNILIIEDDKVTAHAYGQLLRKAGYQVNIAGTGRDAITCMESSPPDAVLLDIMLPELDGIEVLRWIRARTPKLPVVVCTAAFSPILTTLALMGGATRVFDKSVARPSELLHEFDLALGRRPKHSLAA